LVPKEMTLTFV